MLRTYALSPQVLRRVLRGTFWRFQIITTLSFLVFGLYLVSFGRPVQWVVALPILGLIGLAYFFIIFFNYRQQMRQLYSVRVELDNNSIVYRQMGAEPQRGMRADIIRVREHRNGLLVETVDPQISLFIPRGLTNEGDQDVRATLEAWVGIERWESYRREEAGMVVFGLVTSLLILLFANTLWLIAPLVVLLIAYGAYTERRLSRRHDKPPGLVRFYNMAFSFLLFMILMKSCLIGAMAMLAR